MTRIAVIGAGLSGLVVARSLSDSADVTLFEKSRGPGGRMATRYAYPHFVGTPRMNRIGKYLSAGLEVRFEITVTRLARRGDRWTLYDAADGDLGQFDWLVLTTPAPQAQALGKEFRDIVSLCRGRSMSGCFALMLGFAEAPELPWQAALVRDADISWVSVNSSKPGRTDAFTLVVHSTNVWADAHIDEDSDSIIEHMLTEASLVAGKNLRVATHCQLHRWRYANIEKQTGPPCYVSADLQLGVCGDWFLRGRIEAAFTSANDLARELRERL